MNKESMKQDAYAKGTAGLKASATGKQEIPSAPQSRCSRRTFLKMTGAGISAACLGGLAGSLMPAGADAGASAPNIRAR